MKPFTDETWPTDRWPNFSLKEMTCSHTGLCFLDEESMDALQYTRTDCGFPFRITSAYRHESHPVEKKKDRPGAHTTGKAFDIKIQGEDALLLICRAVRRGFTGVGVMQHGSDGRFVHIDHLDADEFHAPRPWIWTYPF
jgi:zinc D-Ala-D-Ala carboxypeptidase